MRHAWTIGRILLLPAALLGWGIAGPTAAQAAIPPLYFANTGGHEIGVATGLGINAMGEIANLSPINASAIDSLGYTDGLAVYGQQLYWTNDQDFTGAGSVGVASLDASGNPIASSVNPDLIPSDGGHDEGDRRQRAAHLLVRPKQRHDLHGQPRRQ